MNQTYKNLDWPKIQFFFHLGEMNATRLGLQFFGTLWALRLGKNDHDFNSRGNVHSSGGTYLECCAGGIVGRRQNFHRVFEHDSKCGIGPV